MPLVKMIDYRFISKDTLIEFVQYGVPLIVTLLFSWILTMSDRFVIEYFRDGQEVGLYFAGTQLAEMPISMISSLIMMSAFPIIIDTWEKKGDDITRDLIANITRYYLLLAIPSLIGITVLSREFMSILGESYFDAYMILPFLAFGSITLGLCMYLNKGLELKKNTKLIALMNSAAAIVNLIFNIILVPVYGYYGAAMSFALTFVVYFVISLYLSQRYLKWKAPVKSIIKILIGSAIMGISLIIVKPYFYQSWFSLIILVGIGIVVYSLVIILSGEVKRN